MKISAEEIALLPSQILWSMVPKGVGYDISANQGGFGSGKSFVAALRGVCNCLANPTVPGLVIGATLKAMLSTVLESYREVFKKFGFIEGQDWFYMGGDKGCIVIPSISAEAKIYFRTAYKPEQYRSMQVGWVNFEECNTYLTEQVYNNAFSRVRHPDWKGPFQIFMQYNPDEENGYVGKLFAPERIGKWVETIEFDGKQVKCVTSYRKIVSTTFENVTLPASYVASLKASLTPQEYERKVLGLDVKDTTRLMVRNWSEANVREVKYTPNVPIHLTCDFNIDPMCWAIFQKRDDTYYFLDEIVLRNSEIGPSVQYLSARWGKAKDKVWIINGDGSGNNRTSAAGSSDLNTQYKILLKCMTDEGFRHVSLDVQRANSRIVNRYQTFNQHVCNASGVRRVIVHPRCETIINSATSLKRLIGGNEPEMPTAKQMKDNPALMYAPHMLDAVSYPIYHYEGPANERIIKKSTIKEVGKRVTSY